MEFPIITTKQFGHSGHYDLARQRERARYFSDTVGNEIEAIKTYLETGTFVAFLIAKKTAGKGTYAKMLIELLGSNRVVHISVGDVVREAIEDIKQHQEKSDVAQYLREHYRGFISYEESMQAIHNQSQSKHLPTEMILALIKRSIDNHQNKAVLIDGFPRSADQIAYSLYVRDIMNARYDPDMFIFINAPTQAIKERMEHRIVCPLCNTSRNSKLLVTEYVQRASNNSIQMCCDNPVCKGFKTEPMLSKTGDTDGMQAIQKRLDQEEEVIERTSSLVGIDSIALNSFIPKQSADDLAFEFELTKEYSFEYIKETDTIQTTTKPWTIVDDTGMTVYGLRAAPVVSFLIKELHRILPI